MSAMDPDPAKTPDLEPGGGVAPGSTPPDTAQTSGLSAPEPSTRHHFPASGAMLIIIVAAIVLVFVAVVIALIVSLA